jgi:hypothetical protein
MAHRAIGLLVLASLAGCVTREIRASPAELEAARALFRAQQPASIKTADHGIVQVTPSQRVGVVDTANKRFDIRVDEIMRDCAEHPSEANRLCELHGVQHVVLGTERKTHEAVYLAPISMVVVGAMLGSVIGVTYCAWECDGLDQRASQVGVGALAVGLLWFIAKHGIAR